MPIQFAKGRWRTVAVGSICEAKTGTVNPTKAPDQPFTYVDIASIDNQAKEIVAPQELLGRNAPSRARRLMQASDVLVSMTRPNLNAVALVPPELDGQVCSTGFCILRAGPLVLPEYLFHFVRSRVFVDHLSALVSGALYPAVTEGQVRDTPIPLPHLDEQRRIVDILNHAASIWRLRKEARAKAHEIIPALFVEMFGDPATNPKGWPIKKLSELGSLDRGKSKHRPRNDPALFGGPYPFIQTGDVANSGGVIRSFTETYSEMGLAQSKLWPSGTLCITIAANIAKTGILALDACFPDSVVGFTPKPEATTRYVQYFLHFLQPYLEKSAPQLAQKNINLEILQDINIPAPPVDIQQEFAERVAEMEGISTLSDRAVTAVEQMTQSLLAQVFGQPRECLFNSYLGDGMTDLEAVEKAARELVE